MFEDMAIIRVEKEHPGQVARFNELINKEELTDDEIDEIYVIDMFLTEKYEMYLLAASVEWGFMDEDTKAKHQREVEAWKRLRGDRKW